MLIKSITKKGIAIPMTPAECVPAAITYGLKKADKSEWILWAMPKSVKLSKPLAVTPSDDKNWEAQAEGIVMIGKTHTDSGKFHITRPHSFKVHYKSSKDILGLPDISIVDFQVTQLPNNPSDGVGPAPQNAAQAPIMLQSGELTPSQPEHPAPVGRNVAPSSSKRHVTKQKL